MSFEQEDLSVGFENSAMFLPSISSIYVRMLSNNAEKPIRDGNLPVGLPDPELLNYLNKDKGLFYYPYTLYSVGHAAMDIEKSDKVESMVQKRDHKNTLVLGDSGGFQIAKGVLEWPWGKPEEEDKMAMDILKWLEHTADWSMTLDVPYYTLLTYEKLVGELAVAKEALSNETEDKKIKELEKTIAGLTLKVDNLPSTGDQCLEQTCKNAEFFMKHRTPGATQFLNVVQGATIEEADVWYDRVKGYSDPSQHENPFEGYAFGGVHSSDFEIILHRVMKLREDGLLKRTKWLHFLGCGKLYAATAFTELQRQIRADPEGNSECIVSYDAASPFVSVAHGQVYSNYVINDKACTLPMGAVIDNKDLTEAEMDLPFMHPNSPIGQRMTSRDICVNLDHKFNSSWDGFSYVLLMAHSLYLHIKGLQTINRIYDMPRHSRPNKYDKESREVLRKGEDVKQLHLPKKVFEMQDIIVEVFEHAKANNYNAAFELIKKRQDFLRKFITGIRRNDKLDLDTNPLFARQSSNNDEPEAYEEIGAVTDALDDPEFAKRFDI